MNRTRDDVMQSLAKHITATVVISEMHYKDANYGGARFNCREMKGHLWNFGPYDPWKEG